MSKNSSLLLFGGLVVIVSFLGIPSSWKTIVFSVLGMLIIIITLFLRKDIATGALCLHLTQEKHTDSYKQNGVLRDGNHSRNQENIPEDNLKNIHEYNTGERKEGKNEYKHDQRTTELKT